MVFEQDRGTCLFIFPRKLGAGITTMLVFMNAIVCIISLMTTDIRFQSNGYSQSLFHVPAIIGSFGVIFGFIGLMGIYEDRLRWIKIFNSYFAVMLLARFAAMISDYLVLTQCEGADEDPSMWPALTKLAEAGVCSWARISEAVGCAVDAAVWLYLLYTTCMYQYMIYYDTGSKIDFGLGKGDGQSRWKLFQVKEPSPMQVPEWAERRLKAAEEEAAPVAFYGATAGAPGSVTYGHGPDGAPQAFAQVSIPEASHGPDGLPRAHPGGIPPSPHV